MESPQVDPLLVRGIEAARDGRMGDARSLLEQIVALDPTVVEAWWWLGEVVEDTNERIVCLENVLTLDPGHARAGAILRRLRASQIQPLPGIEEAHTPPDLEIDPFDDPHLCVYCGQLTHHHDERCSHCDQVLVTHERKARKRTVSLASSMFVVVLLALWSGLLGFGLLLGLSHGGPPPDGVATLTRLGLVDPTMLAAPVFLRNPLLRAIFGDLTGIGPVLARRLFDAATVRLVFFMILGLILYLRWTPAYYGALAALILSMLWDAIQLASGYVGWLGGLIGLGLGGLALVLLFRTEDNFALHPVRIQMRRHPAAKGGPGNFEWGMRYSREGKHALAALHFRKAVGALPTNTEYYKRLGLSYARIGHYARSLRELERARQLSPGDPEIAEISALVGEMKRQAVPEGE